MGRPSRNNGTVVSGSRADLGVGDGADAAVDRSMIAFVGRGPPLAHGGGSPSRGLSQINTGPSSLVEDLKLGLGLLIKHHSAFGRVAVVSDKDWVAHALHAFAWMVPGGLNVFGLSELERAKRWAAG